MKKPREGNGPIVLCVDDEAEILAAVHRCLRNEPYEVVTVQGPAEALTLLGKMEVALVITDQRMPGMSGTELLNEVRARSPRTARAILTGYETPTTIRRGFESGADTFLYKPWDDDALRSTIRRILTRGGWQGPPTVFNKPAALDADGNLPAPRQ